MSWAESLERIIGCGRWDYTVNDSRYTNCAIKIPHSGGMVNIDIVFTTGVICVSGTDYENWTNAVFEAWRSLTVDGVLIPIGHLESENVIPKGPKVNTGESDISIDVERLWEEHKTLKTAFTTLETSVNSLSEDIRDLTQTIQDMKSTQSEESSTAEKKKDKTMITFLETAAICAEGKIDNCKVELKAEIQKQKLLIEKQEARFQRITDTLKNKLDNIPEKPEIVPSEKVSFTPVTNNQELIAQIDINVKNIQKQLEAHLSATTITQPLMADCSQEPPPVIEWHSAIAFVSLAFSINSL